MGFEFQILNCAFQGQIPDFIGILDAKSWIADSTDGCIYLRVIIRKSQERMAKIEEEEKQEHERKKREAEKKKQEIEVAEAMAKKRREEDVDDSKMVSWGFFFICLNSMGGHSAFITHKALIGDQLQSSLSNGTVDVIQEKFEK